MSDRVLWETPKELWDILDSHYHFEFDCCANRDNSKTLMYSDDFLKVRHPIFPSWMNPPFSKAKEMFTHFFQVVPEGVAIYRCDNMETKLWQEIIFPNATWIFIPATRIKYKGFDGYCSRFPSALIGLNVKPPTFLKGTVLMFAYKGVVE
jgi:hypothetical protein